MSRATIRYMLRKSGSRGFQSRGCSRGRRTSPGRTSQRVRRPDRIELAVHFARARQFGRRHGAILSRPRLSVSRHRPRPSANTACGSGRSPHATKIAPLPRAQDRACRESLCSAGRTRAPIRPASGPRRMSYSSARLAEMSIAEFSDITRRLTVDDNRTRRLKVERFLPRFASRQRRNFPAVNRLYRSSTRLLSSYVRQGNP